MCLMLYIATEAEEPVSATPAFSIEEVDAADDAMIRPSFSLPNIRLIGAHTGCSCGFPSVSAEEPVHYFDGMFDDSSDRTEDLESVRALLVLIRRHTVHGHRVEMFPVWFTDQGFPPKGTITLDASSLEPETFFFNRDFFYVVR